jgi:hypothetical protein
VLLTKASKGAKRAAVSSCWFGLRCLRRPSASLELPFCSFFWVRPETGTFKENLNPHVANDKLFLAAHAWFMGSAYTVSRTPFYGVDLQQPNHRHGTFRAASSLPPCRRSSSSSQRIMALPACCT